MRIILTALICTSFLYSQSDTDIKEYLRKIENGKASEVKKILPDLKLRNPDSPGLIYLEGLLQDNGETAAAFYDSVINKYPQSQYADASVYRSYCLYRAAGNQQLSKKYSEILFKKYPASPYVKYIPAEINHNSSEEVRFNYTLQAGAFSNAQNAENLRRKFIKAGYYTFVKDKVIAGTVFKIVYAGRFKTRVEAEDFQVIIDREYGLKGLVTGYRE